MKIEVFKSPCSLEVIAEFDTVTELELYAIKHGIMADCVAINDMVLLGWDELEWVANQFV
jgi:hypothetical protein